MLTAGHRIALIVLALITVSSIGSIPVGFATSHSSVNLSPVNGTVLPFLGKAILLGPLNTTQRITIEFFFRSESFRSNSTELASEQMQSATTSLDSWEESTGLDPGVQNCPVIETSTNSQGITNEATTISSCKSNLLETDTTAGIVEKALHISFDLYKFNNESFYANSQDPLLPTTLANKLIDVEGLNNYTIPETRTQSINGVTSIIPSDIFGYYDFSNIFSAGVGGSGITIAVLANTGYTINLGDVTEFWNYYGIDWKSLSLISIDGVVPNIVSGEYELDSEWAGSTGQGASIDVVTGGSSSTSLIDILSYAVTSIVPEVITTSVDYTLSSAAPATVLEVHQILQQAQVMGVTVVGGSGDSGYSTNESTIGVITSDPLVTSVGGVQDALNSPGTSPGISGQGGWTGTGAGPNSNYSPQPGYQSSESVEAAPSPYRVVPDISFPAAPNIAFYGCNGVSCEGSLQQTGGTSFAGPMFAGLVADVVNYVRSQSGLPSWRVGFLNPLLYELGYSNQYGYSAFTDVTTGNNGEPAGIGWDYVTGIGTPDAWNLVRDVYNYYSLHGLEVIATTSSSFLQGAEIQYSGSGFAPNDPIESCITTNSGSSIACISQTNVDSNGNVSGSMLVGTNIQPGAQLFYVEDTSIGIASNPVSLSISAGISGTFELNPAESGAPAPSFGIGGCDISLTSSSGYVVNYVATPDCELSLTLSSYTSSQFLFAGGSSTITFSTCSEGTCVENEFTYYYQLLESVYYSMSDNSLAPSNPTLTGSQFGEVFEQTLSTSPVSIWLDYGSPWSLSPSTLSGSTATQQWIVSPSSPLSGSIGASGTISPLYLHQYYVTFAPSPSSAGTITPASEWFNAGSSNAISATPMSGYSFSSWSSSASELTISKPSSSSTIISVSAAGTVTANFVATAKMTISLSSTSLKVAPKGSVKTTATITGTPQSVELSHGALPAGITVSFAKSSITDSTSGVNDAITIKASSSAKTGTYQIEVTATGSGGLVSTITITLTVS